MEEVNSPLQRFFIACDDLITGKHILADKKIGEVMRAIATSEELMGLFTTVTDRFDYLAAKRSCLREPDKTRSMRGRAYLPTDEADLLAFVFCLLVELDSGVLRLNDFLLRYFYEDGSLTASYVLFVNKMIRPFRDVVRGCYPNAYKREDNLQVRKEDRILESLSRRAAAENARLSQLNLAQENAVAGATILTELSMAIGRRDVPEIKALLCGYLYYLQVINANCENSNELFALGGEL